MKKTGVASTGDALAPVVMEDPGLTQGPATVAGAPNQTFNGSGVGDVVCLHGVFAAATPGANGDGGIFDTATRTVSSSSDSRTETFKLAGDLSTSTWTVSDDQH